MNELAKWVWIIIGTIFFIGTDIIWILLGGIALYTLLWIFKPEWLDKM